MKKILIVEDDISIADIEKDLTYTWTKNGNVFSCTAPEMIKYFLDFTAPCFLGADDLENYWTTTGVEVEETNSGLELRLVTDGDEGKITNGGIYLSIATITYSK